MTAIKSIRNFWVTFTNQMNWDRFTRRMDRGTLQKINFFRPHYACADDNDSIELANTIFESAESLIKADNNENKNWPEIINLTIRAAKLNHPQAQSKLGLYYKEGFHLPIDIPASINWLESAANLGDIESIFHLITLKENNLYELERLKFFCERSATSINDNPQQNPFFDYYYLRNLLAEPSSAQNLSSIQNLAQNVYQSFLEIGYDFYAQYHLALMDLLGLGIPKNLQKAVDWLQKAAIQGHAKSQFELFFIFTEDNGIPRDRNTAEKWLKEFVHIITPAGYYVIT
jgi:TPR repeat protein